jgi:hypothetical protein
MTDRLEAVIRLAEVLRRENAALDVLDLGAAAGCLPDKQAALSALATATGHDASAQVPPALIQAVRDLQSLAERNRRLLESAMAVQGRVIGLVAQAASRAMAHPRYGAGPGRGPSGRPPAFAVAARA